MLYVLLFRWRLHEVDSTDIPGLAGSIGIHSRTDSIMKDQVQALEQLLRSKSLERISCVALRMEYDQPIVRGSASVRISYCTMNKRRHCEGASSGPTVASFC